MHLKHPELRPIHEASRLAWRSGARCQSNRRLSTLSCMENRLPVPRLDFPREARRSIGSALTSLRSVISDQFESNLARMHIRCTYIDYGLGES